MSDQNCKVSTARAKNGKTFLVFSSNELKDCENTICKPIPILGFPGEYCEDCNNSK